MVGAALQPGDVPALIAAGITHVVDATTHDDSPFLAATQAHPAINVLWLNTADDGQNKVAVYQAIPAWFLAAYVDPNHKFVFHCDGGCNRGPGACCCALCCLGYIEDAAVAAIFAARSAANPNGGCQRYHHDAWQAAHLLGYC